MVVLAAGAAPAETVDLVLIDGSACDHLMELLRMFREVRPEMALMVLGEADDFATIERVVGAGAKGYLQHSVSESELRMAIGVVRDGSVWAPRKVLARLLASSLNKPAVAATEKVRFTKRELEVLRLLVLGHANREIAQELGVDEVTVKAHMGRLMRKASVGNRTALSMRAIELQWV